MLLEEQYTTLQEAVDDKTRKLKKLWTKHKAATTEIDDLKTEFQAEKEDMLDTVRELTRQLKLKHLLLSHFVPLDEAQSLEKRARYDADHDAWQVSRLETKPASLRPRRPISRRGARRVESEYARRNRLIDPLNVRWRSDHVVQLDLEMPERRTRDFEAANGTGYAHSMNYWLERVGVATEEDVEITFANEVEVAPSKLGSTHSNEKAQSAPSAGGKESKEKKASSSSASAGDEKVRKSASKRPPTARYGGLETRDTVVWRSDSVCLLAVLAAVAAGSNWTSERASWIRGDRALQHPILHKDEPSVLVQ
jgi:cell division septum initiation protein DivIVA